MRITGTMATILKRAAEVAVTRYFDCENENEYKAEVKTLFLAICKELDVTEIDLRK